ncbi:uncharacterized protein igsf5b [Acanthochromis polyacanthus]|uniref:uncharacterized protein igsf5b n=1 Tax=Acanthochromis polyacanthus TaxID=80966 RepID=UPI0022344BC2|nr:uncharacterized protein igsf5b [Acanthochromis polyacanthus]
MEAEYNNSSEESGKSLFTVNTSNLRVVAEVVQGDDDCTFPSGVSRLPLCSSGCSPCSASARLCYTQRRHAKANPQEAIRFDQSVFGRSPVAEATGGKVNLGYSNEGATDAAYNDLIAEMRGQMDFVSFHKVPDVVSSSSLSLHSEGQAQVSLAKESSKNVRMITTV